MTKVFLQKKTEVSAELYLMQHVARFETFGLGILLSQ